ncbi:MAG: hypothetical protein EOO73_08635 [Myxococcales bacterium]|nr:MAG: hypothetical protein EOO73_08635 [Myxococcales bacterium]
MSSAPSLTVSLTDVLYRTRGQDWDYAFLLKPPPLLSEGWYALHRRIFSGVEPSEEPLLLRGELGVGVGHPFFATVFVDSVRRDSQGRPVAHYVAWLGKAAEAAPGLSFGPGLIAAIAPALAAVFSLTPEALPRAEGKPLDSLLRARFQAALPGRDVTVLAPPSGSVRWLGTISP